MRVKISFVICGLALLVLFSGCSKSTATSQDPSIEEPKRVLNGYLEGLRDHNIDKVREAVSYNVYQSWVVNKMDTAEMFRRQDAATGAIRRWSFSDESSSVDTVNNQALFKTTVTTDKVFMVMGWDLRKTDRWYIYGSKIISRSNLKKGTGPKVGPMENNYNKFLQKADKNKAHTAAGID